MTLIYEHSLRQIRIFSVVNPLQVICILKMRMNTKYDETKERIIFAAPHPPCWSAHHGNWKGVRAQQHRRPPRWARGPASRHGVCVLGVLGVCVCVCLCVHYSFFPPSCWSTQKEGGRHFYNIFYHIFRLLAFMFSFSRIAYTWSKHFQLSGIQQIIFIICKCLYTSSYSTSTCWQCAYNWIQTRHRGCVGTRKATGRILFQVSGVFSQRFSIMTCKISRKLARRAREYTLDDSMNARAMVVRSCTNVAIWFGFIVEKATFFFKSCLVDASGAGTWKIKEG